MRVKKRGRQLLFIFVFVAASLSARAEAGKNVTYTRLLVLGVPVHVVQVNPRASSVRITPYIPGTPVQGRRFPNSTFRGMVKATAPVAAINGTYHDIRTYRPVGTIVIDGRVAYAGDRGTAICFLESGDVRFYHLSGVHGNLIDWGAFESVLCSGPTLVQKGKIFLDPVGELFRDPEVYRRGRRSAIGLTRGNKLILVAVRQRLTLRELAKIMRRLGCREAVALDGGSSSGLYYRGRFLAMPTRRLSNLLLVYERKELTHHRSPVTKELLP